LRKLQVPYCWHSSMQNKTMRKEPICPKCGTAKIQLSNGILRCPVCRRNNAREYYHQSKRCRSRMREDYYRRTYGMTMSQLEQLLARQQERCAICNRHWTSCALAKHSRYEIIFSTASLRRSRSCNRKGTRTSLQQLQCRDRHVRRGSGSA